MATLAAAPILKSDVNPLPVAFNTYSARADMLRKSYSISEYSVPIVERSNSPICSPTASSSSSTASSSSSSSSSSTSSSCGEPTTLDQSVMICDPCPADYERRTVSHPKQFSIPAHRQIDKALNALDEDQYKALSRLLLKHFSGSRLRRDSSHSECSSPVPEDYCEEDPHTWPSNWLAQAPAMILEPDVYLAAKPSLNTYQRSLIRRIACKYESLVEHYLHQLLAIRASSAASIGRQQQQQQQQLQRQQQEQQQWMRTMEYSIEQNQFWSRHHHHLQQQMQQQQHQQQKQQHQQQLQQQLQHNQNRSHMKLHRSPSAPQDQPLSGYCLPRRQEYSHPTSAAASSASPSAPITIPIVSATAASPTTASSSPPTPTARNQPQSTVSQVHISTIPQPLCVKSLSWDESIMTTQDSNVLPPSSSSSPHHNAHTMDNSSVIFSIRTESPLSLLTSSSLLSSPSPSASSLSSSQASSSVNSISSSSTSLPSSPSLTATTAGSPPTSPPSSSSSSITDVQTTAQVIRNTTYRQLDIEKLSEIEHVTMCSTTSTASVTAATSSTVRSTETISSKTASLNRSGSRLTRLPSLQLNKWSSKMKVYLRKNN